MKSTEIVTAIRAVVDPNHELSDEQLIQKVDKVFTAYFRSLEVTRTRVNRWRARKKAEEGQS